MKILCLFLAINLSFLTLNTLANQPASSKKPAVLFFGTNSGACQDLMTRRLNKAGFNVGSTYRKQPLTWDLAKKYNVIITTGMTESNADGSLNKLNKETLAVLNKFLKNGGGVLVLGWSGQRQTEISPQDAFLNPLGLYPLWGEMPVDEKSIKATAWQVDFAHTANITQSPVTQGVNSFWYPAPVRRIGDQHHSLIFKTDETWKIPVKGSKTSRTTFKVIGSHSDNMKSSETPTWQSEIPLLAYRPVDKGRVVFLAPCFQYIQDNVAFKDLKGIFLEAGLGGKKSDGLKLFINSLNWLAQPSLKSDELGGAANNEALLKRILIR